MEKNEIEKKVFYIILNEVKSKAKAITLNTNIREFGWNSMDVIEIIIALEETFKIDIASDSDDEVDFKSGTINDLINYVYKKVEELNG